MDDDLNTPVALAIVFELAKELRKVGNVLTHQGEVTEDPLVIRQQWQTLVVLSQVLGLEAQNLEESAPASDGLTDEAIETLIQQRQAARVAKNWAEADRLRQELQAQNITLIDQPDGTTRWQRS
jgi:cysteinyl-tRNA synthetase